jgi:cation:H+ antiporter
MVLHAVTGIISLLVMLVFCELLSNSLFWTGKRSGFDAGASGAVLSAASTAVPAAIVPLMAVIFIPGNAGHDIAKGAILGAPLLLSTLLFGLVGAAAIMRSFTDKKNGAGLDAGAGSLIFDLIFFMVVLVLGAMFSMLPPIFRKLLSPVFILLYIFYLAKTTPLNNRGSSVPIQPLYFSVSENPGTKIIWAQNILSLAGIIAGAVFFSRSLAGISAGLGVNPFLAALIAAPIACELPEKFSSVIWTVKKMDGRAISNISSALVFQVCILVFIGVAATDWELGNAAKLAVLITLLSTAVTAVSVWLLKKLHAAVLAFGLVFYAAFVIIAIKWVA